MAYIKCNHCHNEFANDEKSRWWVCNCCGFRVCGACILRHTGSYGDGTKCSHCVSGWMEQKE